MFGSTHSEPDLAAAAGLANITVQFLQEELRIRDEELARARKTIERLKATPATPRSSPQSPAVTNGANSLRYAALQSEMLQHAKDFDMVTKKLTASENVLDVVFIFAYSNRLYPP